MKAGDPETKHKTDFISEFYEPVLEVEKSRVMSNILFLGLSGMNLRQSVISKDLELDFRNVTKYFSSLEKAGFLKAEKGVKKKKNPSEIDRRHTIYKVNYEGDAFLRLFKIAMYEKGMYGAKELFLDQGRPCPVQGPGRERYPPSTIYINKLLLLPEIRVIISRNYYEHAFVIIASTSISADQAVKEISPLDEQEKSVCGEKEVADEIFKEFFRINTKIFKIRDPMSDVIETLFPKNKALFDGQVKRLKEYQFNDFAELLELVYNRSAYRLYHKVDDFHREVLVLLKNARERGDLGHLVCDSSGRWQTVEDFKRSRKIFREACEKGEEDRLVHTDKGWQISEETSKQVTDNKKRAQ